MYCLLKKGCIGTLKKEKIAVVVKELVQGYPQVASLIGDCFAILDEETSIRQELREKFVGIVKSLDGIINGLLVERLNIDNLAEVGVIANKKLFNTRFIRLKTKL